MKRGSFNRAMLPAGFNILLGCALFAVSLADGEASGFSLETEIARASITLKASSVPEGGLTIAVPEGHYYFEEGLTLGPEFKGTAERPIVIRAAEGAEVVFDGSVRIDPLSFQEVTDAAERKRLAAAAVDRIRVTAIKSPKLIARFRGQLMLNLWIDGRDYLPAVFPNEGYANLRQEPVVHEIAPPAVPVGEENYGVRAGNPPHQEPDKPQGWRGSLKEPRGACARLSRKEDMMGGTWEQWEAELARDNTRNQLTGFIEANWLLSSQSIYAASAENRYVHLSRALSYGWAWRRKDKDFRVFGLLCELDAPGEWYFDIKTSRLFIYPPKPFTEESRIAVSVADGFVTLKNTEHVSIIGLDVQSVGSGCVYRVDGGSHNLIADAVIRNSTATGLFISGTHNRAEACDLHDLNRHIDLRGGRRSPDEIVAGHNLVQNCHIFQKRYRHEKVNVAIRGVGQTFRHNLVHNSIGQAVVVNGNDHLLELNEFFNIGFEEGDGGAVYSGADLTGYGNVYRHNFFHHLMHHPGKVPRNGIHLDDHQAGSICVGNIFYKSAKCAIQYNGGAGHVAYDNVFLRGLRGVHNRNNGPKTYQWEQEIAADPEHRYRNTKENYLGRAEKIVGRRGWARDPWKTRYPLLHRVMSDDGPDGRLSPTYCRIENNFYFENQVNHTKFDGTNPAIDAKNRIWDRGDIRAADFVDYANMDFRFRSGSKDLPKIPFEQIGLITDAYRRSIPDKQRYRRAVQEFFKGVESMPGTKRQIDTASIVEASAPTSARASRPKVLLLGDDVMRACQSELVALAGDRAEYTFVDMPKTGEPDWGTFCRQHVYGKGYKVIHFSYGRELMYHEGGKPRGASNRIWGTYNSLIGALQKSDAFLIGCTTTPVRGSMPGYDAGIDWTYGSRFKQQLGPAGIKINDLGDYTRTRISEMVRPNSNLPTELGAQLMAEQVANSVFEALNEGHDPGRPRILLVGDSIVGGYYGATRDLFAREAVVYSGGTTYNDPSPDWKKIVDEYIAKGGERGWDVIQFNWGLHAVKHVDADSRTLDADQPGARVQFTPEAYAVELEAFVRELKRTGAKLVFATTTPIPEGASGAIVFTDLDAYNGLAKAIMRKHRILVNDLYSLAAPRLKELQIRNNVHFTAYGSEQLARQNHAMIKPLISTDR